MTRLAPALDTTRVAGAYFVEGDGYVDPLQCAQAYAGAARDLGVEIATGVQVSEIRIDRDCHELPEAFHRVLEYGMLASRRKGVDPMDLAVIDLGDRFLAASEHLHPSWILEREYELTPQLLAMSHAWTTEAAGFAAWSNAAFGPFLATNAVPMHNSQQELTGVIMMVVSAATGGLGCGCCRL